MNMGASGTRTAQAIGEVPLGPLVTAYGRLVDLQGEGGDRYGQAKLRIQEHAEAKGLGAVAVQVIVSHEKVEKQLKVFGEAAQSGTPGIFDLVTFAVDNMGALVPVLVSDETATALPLTVITGFGESPWSQESSIVGPHYRD